jgi:hypothetical protein
MRRKSFFAQLLAATARVAPNNDLVQGVATANRASRPASQLVAAIARTTPAFKPASTSGWGTAPGAPSPDGVRPQKEPVAARGISPEMIEAAQRHIYDALAQTSAHSTLTEDEQDMLLAVVCAEACGILDAWANSSDWGELAPSGPFAMKPIADAAGDWKLIEPFLDPLKETVSRISARRHLGGGAPEILDPAEYIEKLISRVKYTSHRFRRLSRQDLYLEANRRMRALEDQVCIISRELRTRVDDGQKRRERRSRARAILGTVDGLLLSVSLAMASAGLSAVRQNLPQRGHEAVQVLVVHHIADTVTPIARLTPQSGPWMQ